MSLTPPARRRASFSAGGTGRRLRPTLLAIVMLPALMCARTARAAAPAPELEEAGDEAGGLQALAALALRAATAARNLVGDALGSGGAAAASPMPFAPLCAGGEVSVYRGSWEPPTGGGGADGAYVTVPRGPCAGAPELPLVILHHGFMVPASWMQPYAELIAGFGGFVVAAYDGANFVPDSIVAYDWLDPFVAWVLERERAGALGLPPGYSIDAGGIGVIGHSRGGNIAALQLNATGAAAVVRGGYLIDPVGCGTRFAACGEGADGALDVGAYRAGWTAVAQAGSRVWMTAAAELSSFNDAACACAERRLDAEGLCPVLLGVSCDDVVQNRLFFDAAAPPSVRYTLEGAEHWSFLRQPYINRTSATAIAWLVDRVRGEPRFLENAYRQAVGANGTVVDRRDA